MDVFGKSDAAVPDYASDPVSYAGPSPDHNDRYTYMHEIAAAARRMLLGRIFELFLPC